MNKGAPPGAKVDRVVEPAPVMEAGWRIQPVARLVGWELAGAEQVGAYAGKAGRMTPLEVRIERNDEQEILAIEDPLQEPLRGIFSAAAMVAALCMAIMLTAQVMSRRR